LKTRRGRRERRTPQACQSSSYPAAAPIRVDVPNRSLSDALKRACCKCARRIIFETHERPAEPGIDASDVEEGQATMDLDIKIPSKELFASGSRSLRNWKRLEQQHLALARRLSISRVLGCALHNVAGACPQDVALKWLEGLCDLRLCRGAGCQASVWGARCLSTPVSVGNEIRIYHDCLSYPADWY